MLIHCLPLSQATLPIFDIMHDFWASAKVQIRSSHFLGVIINKYIDILDFRFSPCSETCMFSFGYFPGVRLSFAEVSEPSVRSIFKGWMKNNEE
jgi:hypothetical protein